jgi:hypothetical protein
MAGKIIADQIEHSTAGSLDTSYVVNGSAKSWIRFNGSGTAAIDDSFNAASLTDHGTGEFSYSYTNSMANADYTISLFARDTTYDRAQFFQSTAANGGLLSTTGVGGFCSAWTGGGNWSAGTDAPRLGITVHGDLA